MYIHAAQNDRFMTRLLSATTLNVIGNAVRYIAPINGRYGRCAAKTAAVTAYRCLQSLQDYN